MRGSNNMYNDEYTLIIQKQGDLQGLYNRLSRENVVDKRLLNSMFLNTTVDREDYRTLMELAYKKYNDAEFNEKIIYGIKEVKTGKIFARKYKVNNNIKQSYLMQRFLDLNTYNTVRVDRETFYVVDPIEIQLNKPFYEFTANDVKKFCLELSRANMSPKTIDGRISTLSSAWNTIAYSLLNYSDYMLNTNNNWTVRNSVSTTAANLRQYITYDALMNDIMKSGMSLQETIVILLVFIGCRLPSPNKSSKEQQKENEISFIKDSDLQGNKLRITNGLYPRIIELNDEEAEWIKKAIQTRPDKTSPYLVQPVNHRRNRNTPLGRWAIWNRMTNVSKGLYGMAGVLTYINVHASGMCYYMLKLMNERNLDINSHTHDLMSVAAETLIHFNELSEEDAREGLEEHYGGKYLKIGRLVAQVRQYSLSIAK